MFLCYIYIGDDMNFKLKEKDMDKIEIFIHKLIKSLLVFCLFYNSAYILITVFGINYLSLSPIMRILISLLSSTLLAFVFYLIYRKDLKEDWKIFKSNLAENFNIGTTYWFIGILVMVVSNNIIIHFLDGAQPGNEQAVQSMIDVIPWAMVISAGFLAPINEEIVFRKSLKDIIKNKYFFVILSGLMFGLAHVIGNTNSWVDWLYVIPYGALGVSFAASYQKTNTVFTPICIHMLHNLILTLSSIFFY